MEAILTLCRDLSWVDHALAARLSDGVAKVHSALEDIVGDTEILGVRSALIAIGAALLFHDPRHQEMRRLVAELRRGLERTRLQRDARVGG